METGGERNKKIVQFRRVQTAPNKQKKEIRYRRKITTRANCNKHQHKESEQISQLGDLRLHQNLINGSQYCRDYADTANTYALSVWICMLFMFRGINYALCKSNDDGRILFLLGFN